MNSIDRINKINLKELEDNVPDSASWHMDYKDSNYIYIGGLNPKLMDKDILTIFSQFGLPTHIKLLKDKDEHGNVVNKGFGYLKYLDFRSCVLAVDNLNGIIIYDKKIKVDHCWFQLRDNETEDDYHVDYDKLVPKTKEIEYPLDGEKTRPKDEGHIIKDKEEDFNDPLEDMNKLVHDKDIDIDDELKDPMAGFVSKRRSGSTKHIHKSKKQKSEKKQVNEELINN